MSPIALNLYATLKLHKDKPIRRIINWEKCPRFRISKTIIQNITQLLAATLHI
jgi:hypothetical protein